MVTHVAFGRTATANDLEIKKPLATCDEAVYEKLKVDNVRLREAATAARKVLGESWPFSTPESEPEKSVLDALNKLDSALKD